MSPRFLQILVVCGLLAPSAVDQVSGLECLSCLDGTEADLCRSPPPYYETCPNENEVCFSRTWPYTPGSSVLVTEKGCMDNLTCDNLASSSDDACRSGTVDNLCVYCCDADRCNVDDTDMCAIQANEAFQACVNTTVERFFPDAFTDDPCLQLNGSFADFLNCTEAAANMCPWEMRFKEELLEWFQRATGRVCELFPNPIPRQNNIARLNNECHLNYVKHTCFNEIQIALKDPDLTEEDIFAICADKMPEAVECAATIAEGCTADEQLEIFTLIITLNDKNCPNASLCYTEAAEGFLDRLKTLKDNNEINEACLFRHHTKVGVEDSLSDCTEEASAPIRNRLNSLLTELEPLCTDIFLQCQGTGQPIVLIEGGDTKQLRITLNHGPSFLCGNTPDCRLFLDLILEEPNVSPRCEDTDKPAPKILVGDIQNPSSESKPFVEITQANPVITFKLTTNLDFKTVKKVDRKSHVYLRKTIGGVKVEEASVIICTYEVDVQPKSLPGQCYSVNDPHIRSFDGRAIECHAAGVFRLYRHAHYPYEVQARYVPCYPGGTFPACNCAVYIRSWNTMYVVDGCWRSNFDIYTALRTKDSIDLQTFTSPDGKIIEVILPHGHRIKIHLYPHHQYSLINVFLYASPYDYLKTEGLCGFFNGDPNDDGVPDCASDRLPDNEILTNTNFFHTGIIYTSTVPDTCLPVPSTDPEDSDPRCDPDQMSLYDACHLKLGHETTLSGTKIYEDTPGTTGSRSHEFQGKIVPFGVTDLSWNETTARQTCEDYLLNDDKVDRCRILPAVDIQATIETCILDILATGSTDWLEVSRDTIVTSCLNELRTNPVYMEGGPGHLLGQDFIQAELCTTTCSGNGICKEASCICNVGYYGPDCSLTQGTAPSNLALLNNGQCDTSTEDCDFAVVEGNNLFQTDDLKCSLKPAQVLEGNDNINQSEIVVPGVLVNIGQVACGLPPSHAGFDVRITLDGTTYSADLHYVRYDYVCNSCTASTDGTFDCTLKNDTCSVDGQCYVSGGSSVDSCWICSPGHSTDSFSKKSGIACWDQWKIIVLAVGLALALALIVLIPIIFLKLKPKPKVSDSSLHLSGLPESQTARSPVPVTTADMTRH